MATMITRDQVAAAFASVAQAMIAGKDELTALDAELGDGDLGRTVERGFTAIHDALAAGGLPDDAGKLIYQLGKSFANAAPSSFGALFGTALMKGGMALKDKTSVSFADVANATETALNALMERGKAQLGNKTMLDAIHPALVAMRAHDTDAPTGAFLRAAADAAQRGAEDTAGMQSQIGRASWQGERSSGKMDPGARAIAMMFDAAARHFEEQPA